MSLVLATSRSRRRSQRGSFASSRTCMATMKWSKADRFFRSLRKSTSLPSAWALRHRFITLGILRFARSRRARFIWPVAIGIIAGRWKKAGGFVLDYKVNPPGTSLAESNAPLMEIEKLLKQTPEVESYSRRTGVALGLELTEPNAGDFLVKLRQDSNRSTEEVIAELREKIKHVEPQVDCDLRCGMLGDTDRRSGQLAQAGGNQDLLHRPGLPQANRAGD